MVLRNSKRKSQQHFPNVEIKIKKKNPGRHAPQSNLLCCPKTGDFCLHVDCYEDTWEYGGRYIRLSDRSHRDKKCPVSGSCKTSSKDPIKNNIWRRRHREHFWSVKVTVNSSIPFCFTQGRRTHNMSFEGCFCQPKKKNLDLILFYGNTRKIVLFLLAALSFVTTYARVITSDNTKMYTDILYRIWYINKAHTSSSCSTPFVQDIIINIVRFFLSRPTQIVMVNTSLLYFYFQTRHVQEGCI